MDTQTPSPITILNWYLTALEAARQAMRGNLPGRRFLAFGRRFGRRLLSHGLASGMGYLLTPVQSFRFYEFAFAWRHIRAGSEFLDLASPRLFSFAMAEQCPRARILMLNPDGKDIAATERFRQALGFGNIATRHADDRALTSLGRSFDAAWSISVIEHVAGPDGDMRALECLARVVRPGGRLLVSVPVDRSFRDEYLDDDPYGTSVPGPDGRYFFQRVYDLQALETRLWRGIGLRPSALEWVGERRPGFFGSYQDRMRREGHGCTCRDPEMAGEDLRIFPDWYQMPGFGVCSMVFEIP